RLNWAGTTGSNEFMFAAFLKNAGLSMSKVPYRNLVEAANDLAIGRIQVNVTAFAIARPQLEAGKVKLLAVTNTRRAAVVPEVPTVAEAGYPDLVSTALSAFSARRPCPNEFAKASPRMFARPLIRRSRNG